MTGRTDLLGDFHVRMAELMHNDVLAQSAGRVDLALRTDHLMYQSRNEAEHSSRRARGHRGLLAEATKTQTWPCA